MKLWKILLVSLVGGLWWQSSSQFLYAQQSQAATQQDSWETMEDSLFAQLANLKSSSHQLTEDLKTLQEELKLSRETLDTLSNAYESTLTQFEQCAQSLSNTKLKLQDRETRLRKLTIILIIVGVLAIGARAVIIWLKLKGVSINYWLNTLL